MENLIDKAKEKDILKEKLYKFKRTHLHVLILTLPNDKIWVQSNLKAFADNLNVVQMMICVTDWVENIVEKGENAGY